MDGPGLVSRVGFEPTTDRLKGGCSTAELTARAESSTRSARARRAPGQRGSTPTGNGTGVGNDAPRTPASRLAAAISAIRARVA